MRRLPPLIRAVTLLLLMCAMPARAAAPLTVFAAASLTDALGEAGRAYTARTGVPVRFSFAASATVARQIETGARADLFVSADRQWMDYLAARGRIAPATRIDLLAGRLALIAPRGSRVALPVRPGMPLAAALGARGRLALGDPAYVPAGRYAQAALIWAGAWPQVAGRLARADNVRVALGYVARGEAPLGIVYETDAIGERGVRIVGLFPPASHPPIVYPAAVIRGAAPGAAAFAAFLRSPPARAIFRRHGFRDPGAR